MTYHVKTALLALATALPTHALADWNGAYVGFSLGANTTNELSGDGEDGEESIDAASSTAFGVFGGYAVQNNDFVFGGEVAFLRAPDVEFKDDEQEVTLDFDIIDLKGRAGYVVNNILFYGVAGFSRISEQESGDHANGFNFGVGADYDLGNNFVIGVEYLARRGTFEDLDVALDTLSLRAAYRF
ncbi:outer membrane beta-barrel protein [uncultured Tateyamaria sp.]|uniref:outer membrane protein n=1 Tax=uncultured Tateyamaria sp. TaxID=455651 RepID=UPI00260A421F|nr:outer membrane beta-barrel protein [uncultured Tateyamaria sp.]